MSQSWLLLCCSPRQQWLIKLHKAWRRCQLAQQQLIKSTNQPTLIAAKPWTHCEYLIRPECYFFLDFFPFLNRCSWFGNHKMLSTNERLGYFYNVWGRRERMATSEGHLSSATQNIGSEILTTWFITASVWSAHLQNERGKVGESFHCVLCTTIIWGQYCEHIIS